MFILKCALQLVLNNIQSFSIFCSVVLFLQTLGCELLLSFLQFLEYHVACLEEFSS